MADYRVLIADDHPLYRDALGNLVRAAFEDAVVLECEDVGSVLRLLREDKLDLVLLDLAMPVLDGLGCLKELRQRDPACPIVMTSGNVDEQRRDELLEHGAAGVLYKPYGMVELIAAIRDALPGGAAPDAREPAQA